MHLCAPEAHFIDVGDAALERAQQNILQLAVIAKQLQQGLPARAMLAYAEQVFRRRVHILDQKILIDDGDGCVQVFQHLFAPRWISTSRDFPTLGFAGRRMIRQLAHEIKNPLGGLRGAAQLLDRQLDSEELREYTSVIISEADRLAGLVDTLLGPGGPPNKQAINLHEPLEYVVRLIEPGRERISIRRDYDPGLPLFLLDRDQMVQAFLNLLQNASTALDGQGEITVRTRAIMNFTIGDIRHRAVASIEIEDDGPGIPSDLQDSIFYPLVTSRPEGTGLGLPTAQELISRHGGLIEFESRPGRTVFFVRIPLDEPETTIVG